MDPGSPGNLCGDQWVAQQAKHCAAHGKGPPTYRTLPKPLEVGGVGHGVQVARTEVTIPVGFEDGEESLYTAPVMEDSTLPALLGQRSLMNQRAIIDCYNKNIYFIGPGGYRLNLSPGSTKKKLHDSAGGHLMMPCSRFTRPASGTKGGNQTS